MAKKCYIGIDGKARRVKKMYVGVDDKARKVKKGYVGVGGIARLFFTAGELAYWGQATSFTTTREEHTAASNSKFAIFTQGRTYNSKFVEINTSEGYYEDLTRFTPATSGYGRLGSGLSFGEYAVIASGGTYASAEWTSSRYTYFYNTSATKTSNTNLYANSQYKRGTSVVGNYALFVGGGSKNTGAFDKSLTYTTPTALEVIRGDCNATTVGNHAIFAGGHKGRTSSGYFVTTVDVYDDLLTKSTATDLPCSHHCGAATTVGDYAIIAGGASSGAVGAEVEIATVYNKSLTQSFAPNLGYAGRNIAATTLENFAIFAGGAPSTDVTTNMVVVYDDSLTRTANLTLSESRKEIEATTIGKYALFGGGSYYVANNNDRSMGTVDAFIVN